MSVPPRPGTAACSLAPPAAPSSRPTAPVRSRSPEMSATTARPPAIGWCSAAPARLPTKSAASSATPRPPLPSPNSIQEPGRSPRRTPRLRQSERQVLSRLRQSAGRERRPSRLQAPLDWSSVSLFRERGFFSERPFLRLSALRSSRLARTRPARAPRSL